MGISAWAHGGNLVNATACPFACRPLPLMNGTAGAPVAVVEQPTDLATLTQR